VTQQYPLPPSKLRSTDRKLRESFLIVGIVLWIVLLTFSFISFYAASRANWDYVATNNDEVNLAYPAYGSEYPQLGAWEYYVRGVFMQPNDLLTVSAEQIQINGTFELAIMGLPNGTLLASSSRFAFYQNDQGNAISVNVCVIAQNMQNVTLSTLTTLNHYETPQWVYFGVGVALSSLAVIPIFKSKR